MLLRRTSGENVIVDFSGWSIIKLSFSFAVLITINLTISYSIRQEINYYINNFKEKVLKIQPLVNGDKPNEKFESYIYDTDYSNNKYIKDALSLKQLQVLDKILEYEKDQCVSQVSSSDLINLSKNDRQNSLSD